MPGTGDPETRFLRQLNEMLSLPHALLANPLNPDLIYDFIAGLCCVQSRNRGRSVQKPCNVRSVMQLALKRERMFVGHPPSRFRLQPLDQIRSHVEVSGARPTAQPLNRTAGSEINLQVFHTKRHCARRLVSVEHDHRSDFVRAASDRLRVLQERALEQYM